MSRIVIESRFRGPPASGNGGYVCGLLARFIEGPAEVTLRMPPPLDTPLVVERADGRAVLRDGDTVVAEAVGATVDIEPPAFVELERATEAASRSQSLDEHHHPYPGCFVCGPARAAGDGLRIFAGPAGAEGIVAAPWTPDASLADDDGVVRPEFVWASVDCPGAFALFDFASDIDNGFLLGRLAARIEGPVVAGRPYVVAGWALGSDGRKHFAGTALYAEDGTLRAVGRQTWLHLKK